MKIAVCIYTFACLAQFHGSVQAGERSGADRPAVNRRTGLFEPPLSDLRKAAEHGDRVELARTAGRLGPARLAKALDDRDADRSLIAAALESVPLVDAGLLLFDSVLPHVLSPEGELRSRAVAAIASLLARSNRDRIEEWEVAGETTRAVCQALARVTRNEGETPATRLLAVQGLADAGRLCEANLVPTSLATAQEPELRRASVLALPLAAATDAALLVAARDNDSRVAAAAGARLCQRQAKSPPLPGQPPLRQLAMLEGALPEDTIEILPCLVASTDPADKAAIEAIEKSGSTAAREAIKRLRQTGQGL